MSSGKVVRLFSPTFKCVKFDRELKIFIESIGKSELSKVFTHFYPIERGNIVNWFEATINRVNSRKWPAEIKQNEIRWTMVNIFKRILPVKPISWGKESSLFSSRSKCLSFRKWPNEGGILCEKKILIDFSSLELDAKKNEPSADCLTWSKLLNFVNFLCLQVSRLIDSWLNSVPLRPSKNRCLEFRKKKISIDFSKLVVGFCVFKPKGNDVKAFSLMFSFDKYLAKEKMENGILSMVLHSILIEWTDVNCVGPPNGNELKQFLAKEIVLRWDKLDSRPSCWKENQFRLRKIFNE